MPKWTGQIKSVRNGFSAWWNKSEVSILFSVAAEQALEEEEEKQAQSQSHRKQVDTES